MNAKAVEAENHRAMTRRFSPEDTIGSFSALITKRAAVLVFEPLNREDSRQEQRRAEYLFLR
jgi:hypothetical protein